MKATLTELAKHTADVVGPVIEGGKTVEITQHGQVRAKIVPVPKLSKAQRRAAWEALKAIGPVDMPHRK